jgi:asparagine synthase (glutamine-hydrolysing)
MCGIVGAWAPKSQDKIEKAMSLIAHRGPDDSGSFAQGDVSLGHVRLAIQDLSELGHQPMRSDDENVVLIFNGEIYNVQELRTELIESGFSFKGHSDTEVLLKLYLRDGPECLMKLNGIFSFAIWNSSKQRLFIARDRMGVKPLYYYRHEDEFYFASEIKALSPFLKTEPELDRAALNRYLSYLWCPGEGTPIKEVKKLPPGEAMLIKNGKIEKQWQWYKAKSPKGQYNKPIKNLIRETQDTFKKAVEKQLISDAPVGAFLSGGLDSSSIVAVARESLDNIPCFTIESQGASDPGVVDDLKYAETAARHLKVPLQRVVIDSKKMSDDLEEMIYLLDEPLADPAALNVKYICREASRQGIKVLLSGSGGDDIFTGYRRHAALNFESCWSWLPLMLRHRLKRVTQGSNQQNPVFRKMTKLFAGANLEGDERLIHYFSWCDRDDLEALYTEEFKLRLNGERASTPMLKYLEDFQDAHRLEKMLLLEQRFFLTDHNLTYTDKMSMSEGIEVRVPFLDNELVDFSKEIPTNYKQCGRVGKWIFKKAMEKYLPNEIIYRPKTGFGAPVRRWIQHELKELVGDYLSEDSLKSRGLFNSQAVQKMIVNNRAGRIDASYTILSMLCIEIWCRRFIDQRTE